MGGRGGSGGLTSYQGQQYNRASSSGVNVSGMKSKLDGLPEKVVNDVKARETISQINSISSQNDTVTIYRATVGDTINSNDWIFLSRAQAEKWSKTALGTPKPGVKVLERKVKAKDVYWSGKNLEFVYTGKKRK
jgi:hypothetical protein